MWSQFAALSGVLILFREILRQILVPIGELLA
jgi:hypothetical protein